MAIISMRKLSLVCLRGERESILKKMQAMQCVEVIEQPLGGEDAGIALLEMRDDISAVGERSALLGNALASLQRYAPEKKGMFAQREQLDAQGVAEVMSEEADVLAVCRDIAAGEAQIADIRQRRARIEAQIEQLRPLEGFDLPLELACDTETSQAALGTVHPSRMEELMEQAAQSNLVQFIEVGRTPDAVYLFMLAHGSVDEETGAMLSSVGFTKLTLKYEGTAAQVIAGFAKDLQQDDKSREELTAVISSHAKLRGNIQALIDLSTLELERLEASTRLNGTKEALQMTAWVPSNCEEELAKELEALSSCIALEFTQPDEEDDVPTFIENNKFVTPYESVTGMFSTPSKGDIDPAPYLMPFFVIFFGMMVSDAGYGIILCVIGFLGAYVLKMRGMMGQICKILIVGGVLTAFWGALFGGWFGIEGIEAPLFSPMYEPISMLILCFSLGLVHILAGMIIKMVMSFKAGDWQTAVFDQIGWMAIILGGVAFAAAAVLGIKPLDTIGAVVAIIGLLMVLLFAGRDKNFGIGRIISGLGSLYGVTSYLSDVLSYARLFAMGLATGVICMVFNTIAGLLLSSPIGFIFGIAVLIVGHGFNLAINALGAYVHSCRLQYIEFFGKFFEGGGRAFKPLMKNTRYIDFKS